ncbi:hypothetical protein XM48_06825 [Leucobacter sp. Ag1]|nr:hypothetical protein XM48_06825 [Leucobacter sp. Ag1]
MRVTEIATNKMRIPLLIQIRMNNTENHITILIDTRFRWFKKILCFLDPTIAPAASKHKIERLIRPLGILLD